MSLSSPYQEHYYVADGVTTTFAFGSDFTALSSSYVKCIIYFEDGTNCVPTFNVDLTTGYINIVTLTKPDGTVLTVPPAGSIVRVFRDVPEQQNVTASQLQNYTAKQLEKIFDSVVAMIQEVSYSDLHKTIRLTETQRDVAVEQLTEEKDQSILYWDFESHTLKATDYGQDEVVKSETVDRLVYLQPEGKIYFIPKGSNNPIAIGSATIHNDLGGRNAPDCHPESAITNLTTHLQELRDRDTAIEYKADQTLSKAGEALDTANHADANATYAVGLVNTFDGRLTQAESDASEAKEKAIDAKTTVDNHVLDYNNPHQVTKAQVGLGNCDNTSDEDKPISTATQDALDGLQDQIDDLSGRGRFLALWNCATGLAESNPPESPYTYKAGDYFVVGTVSSATPAVNYKPDGSSYTTGVASTTVETNEVSVNDTYFYDGSVWKLQSNAQKEVSFSALAGSPYDNTNLSNALNAKQNTLTAGTNITIDANNVISSTAQESFFRGNFSTWENVPTNVNGYKEDIHGNRIPQNTDFIVVEDASQFIPSGSLIHKLVVENLHTAGEKFTIRITDENGVSQKYYYASYLRQFVAIDDYYSLQYVGGAPGLWYIKTNDGSPIIIKGTKYQSGEALLCLTSDPATPFDAGMPPSAGQYTGAWRFAYYGVWSTAGITGWTPQYKIENTLPVADGETLGIAKLYTTTGNNTDGSMSQNSITTALNTKITANATITGATHTKITYDNKGLVTAGADITLSDVTDITATAAEVNVLDGITASTTELNYTDGVTSNIQTQIDGKQATISDLATIRSGASAGATAVQPSDLATVATSGSYNDLSDTPTIPTVNNSTITITQGGVTKGSFTLNQATGDTIALDAGGGGSADIDNLTITENTDQEIQAVAVIDQNTGIAKTWTGTMAEYDAIVTKDPETEYIITDDIGGSATEIGEITEALNDKVDKGHQVIEFQEPNAGNNYTWYRKYADGWVEQGGYCYASGSAAVSVSYPIELSRAEIPLTNPVYPYDSQIFLKGMQVQTVSTTGFTCRGKAVTSNNAVWENSDFSWQVSGMAA